MGRLKLSDNLFLGSKELNFLRDSLSTDGFKRLFPDNVFSYGVVIDSNSPNSLRVIQDPDNANMVLVQSGSLINGNLDYGTYTQDPSGFTVPTGQTIYITASIQESVDEPGMVTIDADGNVTGVGTSFTDTMRGAPNFPTKVSFPDASVNVNEYTVREVVSDTLLRLNVPPSSLSIESIPQPIRVVGTFTPGINIPDQDKNPFIRNRIIISSSTTEPTIGDNLFRLASVDASTGTLVITDERILNRYSASDATLTPLQVTFSGPVLSAQNIIRGITDRYVKVQAFHSEVSFNGISGYSDGEQIIIQNSPFSGSNIVLNHNSTASLPNGVRVFSFTDSENLTLEPGESVTLVYNTTTNNQWQLVSRSKPINDEWIGLGSYGWEVTAPNSVNPYSNLQGVRFSILGNRVTMTFDLSIVGGGDNITLFTLQLPQELLLASSSPLENIPIGSLIVRTNTTNQTFYSVPCFMSKTQLLVGMNIANSIPDGVQQLTGALTFELTR